MSPARPRCNRCQHPTPTSGLTRLEGWRYCPPCLTFMQAVNVARRTELERWHSLGLLG